MTKSEESTFPTDWNAWRVLWQEWKESHAGDMRRPKVRAAGKNFLAGDVLGTWEIGGRTVELSEVTFPDLSSRGETVRYVGVSYVRADRSIDGGELVRSFAELERELGI